MAELSTFSTSQNILGESPFWHEARQSIFWVDIHKGILHEQKLCCEGSVTWNLGKKIAVILSWEGSQLLMGCEDGIVSLNLLTQEWKLIIPIKVRESNLRCNDGSFDVQGNIWIGNMDMQFREGLGSLYRIAKDGGTFEILEGLTIPNGLSFSLDHKRMYFIDTPTRTVKSYLIDPAGNISFEKSAVVIPKNMGVPDGMSIDEQGMLWVALYGGGAVSRWNPFTGELLETIAIPALHITNCCFAGDKLNELIVTSARENMTEIQLAMYPESGNVFRIQDLGVKGVKMLSHKPSTTFFQ
ncbi:SMP-30/gluconolactonase/LRE family protein [Pedobacter sp. JCM 36344]|uniref:SMP-30/gluconolactonase/LRE family protein n=1 Tax=Pedobacter sp. JCM 36344 TaxID=3374280 RepID=UPI00397C4A7F